MGNLLQDWDSLFPMQKVKKGLISLLLEKKQKEVIIKVGICVLRILLIYECKAFLCHLSTQFMFPKTANISDIKINI